MAELINKFLNKEILKITPVLGKPLNEKQELLLAEYIKLLHKWNQAYNLTAVREPEDMIKKHIIDSLIILPILEKDFERQSGPTLVDVGSGAGLPGIPLAIAQPSWEITLVDSNGKKTGFLTAVKRELGLNNISIINDRVENVNQTFDAIICRAFASLKDIVNLTEKLWSEKTCLWAMKGKYPDEELRQLPKSYRVSATYALTAPEITDGERHLLKIIRPNPAL